MKSKHKILISSISLLFILFSTNLNAQDNSSTGIKKEIATSYSLTLQHTTLVVSDFAESKKFYTDILKLKDLKADWLPENQMFLSLGDNLELHVGEVEGVEIKPNGFNHFAVSTDDLDGFLMYLKNQGIEYSSLGGDKKYYIQKRPDGVRQTFIQDPDGYWIEINDAK